MSWWIMPCACWRTCNTVVPKLVTRQVTVLALWCRFLTSLFCCKAFSEALLRKHFGTEISTIGGIGLKDIAREYTELNQAAFFPSPVVKAEEKYFLPNNGLFSYRKDGIEHAWNPETITKLQLAYEYSLDCAFLLTYTKPINFPAAVCGGTRPLWRMKP